MSNSIFNLAPQQRIPYDGPTVVPPGATGPARIRGSNKNHLERLLAMDGNAIHSIARTNPTQFSPVTMNRGLAPQINSKNKPGRGGMNKQVKQRGRKVTAGFKRGSSKRR